jgi:archaellum biogenesis ATPase FlaH
MSKPDIVEKVGGFEMTWPEHKVKVSVTRIKEHRDNRVTGWLMFTSTAAKGVGLIHQCELNFASSQTQRTLANVLVDKKEGIPWDEIIEQCRYYILDRVRQGEPVEVISTTSADITPPTYLIYPILPKGQPTIAFGEPGVGKSRMANLLYVCLTLPWHDNPLGLIVPDVPMRPLILDWETDRNTTASRIKALVEGMNLGAIDVNYRRCLARMSDDLDQIQLAIDKVKADCLIIDSLTAACGGELMKPETAEDFFAAIRKLNMTSFIIGQTQKDPELRSKSILGSTIFEYYARSIWEIKAAQTAGEDEMHVALIHRKANESKRHRSLAYRFYFNEDHITVSTADMTDIPEFNRDVPLRVRIRETLSHGALTAAEIAENIDAKAGTVSKTLSQMKKQGSVISLPDNKWGLPARA